MTSTEGISRMTMRQSDTPEHFDLYSLNIADDKRRELLNLLPEIRTEGGKIDFDRLKQALGEIVDVGKERYGMTWPGKSECFGTIQAPSLGTLRPVAEESVNFDTTENLIIEGDNLEVLKLLQKSYLGKVKMIYIDPPYNTGNDFIYPDNYSESLQTYLEYTGQIDAEGRKFGTNAETDGRFHSKWLNMIYPRLYLARNLLCETGIVFISIDDTEHSNLRRVCDEVFGEENFRADIAWQKRYTRSNNTVDFTTTVEHVLVYSRSDTFLPNLLPRTEEADARYTNPDNDSRGPWKGASFLNPATPSQRPNLCYPIANPKTGKITEPSTNAWRRSKEEFDRLAADNRLYWGSDGSQPVPAIKMFLSEGRGLTPINFWSHEYAGNTDDGTKALADLLGEKVFDNPKPVLLVKRMLEHVADSNCIALDFFAGSGTTAQAVLELNAQDSGNRKFILVQLPEPTDRTDYATIPEICKERLRRAIKKLNDKDVGTLDMEGGRVQDRGFRVFRLAESNFTTWDAQIAHDPKALETQLEFHIDHIREERTSDDILYELLLKSGFPLTTPVQKLVFDRESGKFSVFSVQEERLKTEPLKAENLIYSVAGGALVICLERELTLELIRAIAEGKPERVVCLDEGFAGNDQLKANAVQTFKTKGIVKFQTV